MKKQLTLFALLFTLLVSAQQSKQERQERIKALKIAYITEQLNLTASEAQNFWPLYNDFDAKMEAIRQDEFKMLGNKRIDFKKLSDDEAKDILASLLSSDQKRLDYKKALLENLKDVISPAKALTLLKSEEGFKRKLIKELRGRHREGPPRNRS